MDVVYTIGIQLRSQMYFYFLYYCDKNDLGPDYCLVELMRFQNLSICVKMSNNTDSSLYDNQLTWSTRITEQ